MISYCHILKIIIYFQFLFFPSVSIAEQWDLVLDNGQGSGSCTLMKNNDGSITADRDWTYGNVGNVVYGTYINAPVKIEGTSITFTATGTAISPSSPLGYNTSPYVFTIYGKALNGMGEGTFQSSYGNPFWFPSTNSGIWVGTRISGSGLTAVDVKAMPWLFLLLNN